MTSSTLVPPLPDLPQPVLDGIRRIVSGESLGASKNINEIINLFSLLGELWPEESTDILVTSIQQMAAYLAEVRGKNTPFIGNAIRLYLEGLELADGWSVAQVRMILDERRTDYGRQAQLRMQRIARCGSQMLAACSTVLAFDYSSTMANILAELAAQDRLIHVVVPESRILNGGLPVVEAATQVGHRVTFVPDMAVTHLLPRCDAMLIGAETIFANGDCWNTVGSYPLAVLAHYHRVPFYVASELMKLDFRSFHGYHRPIIPQDNSHIMGNPARFSHPHLVDVTAPDLDNVPGTLISGYATEVGALLPSQLRQEGLKLALKLGLKIEEEEL